MSAALTGCILPPDGKSGDQSLGPYPPQVDLAQVFPRKPRLRFHVSCDDQDLDVAGIVDRDSDQLLFRWVANNSLENTNILQDESQARPFRPVAESIDHRDAFGPLPEAFVGVISLFITDANEWEVANPEPNGESQDWSRIAPGQDDASVVEIRWTFEYNSAFGSDVCGE